MLLVSTDGRSGSAAAPPSVDAGGSVTTNECPHFGHLILRPAGGILRSSIWYGARHDSQSTFTIRSLETYHADRQ